MSVGVTGGMDASQISSWVFAIYSINGVLTVLMSWRFRTSLGFGWTIPGMVLLGPALQHLSLAEVTGAFYLTSILMFILGATGWVKRVMSILPMPIVMGMVAGVFLRFGLDIIRALQADVLIAAPMIIAFLFLSTMTSWAKRIPPVIGALIIGVALIYATNRFNSSSMSEVWFVQPILVTPMWSWTAILELVLPLSITVLVVQNGQGIAILEKSGHEPPVNAIAVVCGLGAAMSASFGAVSSCLTGPSNAIITSSGRKSQHYIGAICLGILCICFGLLSPIFTGLMLGAPKAFIMVLGGLAMLRVLQNVFVSSFGGPNYSLGALVSFLVTLADISLFNIGAAFWGLVAGYLVSRLMEKNDYKL